MKKFLILLFLVYSANVCTAQTKDTLILRYGSYETNSLINLFDSLGLEKNQGYFDTYYIYVCKDIYTIILGGDCNSQWSVWKKNDLAFSSEINELQKQIRLAIKNGSLAKENEAYNVIYRIQCL